MTEGEMRRAFAALAGRAGLDAARYRPVRDWTKREPHRWHRVRLLRGPQGGVVMKRVFRPEGPEAFDGVLMAHRRAAAAVPEGVPRVLAADRDLRAYLMEERGGETLRAVIQSGADPADTMRRAGAWAAAFHRATTVERRTFQPRFMADHLRHLAGQVERGERRIRKGAAFVRHARALADRAPEFEGAEIVVAAKHGDLNDHNLLMGDVVTGIDFQDAGAAPVAYDIARLLLSHAESSADIDAIPRGQVLPPATLAGFFDGYDLAGAEDAPVRFLCLVQILTDWNRLSMRRTLRHEVRFARLRKIAETALG